jgi:hypothetical protein
MMKKSEVLLLISEKSEYGYSHIECNVVVPAEEGSIRNFRANIGAKASEFYDDLVVNCQISDGQSYAFRVSYHNIHCVELFEAQKMGKTLSAIHRRLEKIRETRGSCRHFAEFAGRVAEAIGATFVIRREIGYGGPRYSDQKFRFLGVFDGVYEIAQIEARLVALHTKADD